MRSFLQHWKTLGTLPHSPALCSSSTLPTLEEKAEDFAGITDVCSTLAIASKDWYYVCLAGMLKGEISQPCPAATALLQTTESTHYLFYILCRVCATTSVHITVHVTSAFLVVLINRFYASLQSY